jgi:hypothetical protein
MASEHYQAVGRRHADREGDITSLSQPLEPAVGPIVRSLPTLAPRMTKHRDADDDPDCRQFKGQA